MIGARRKGSAMFLKERTFVPIAVEVVVGSPVSGGASRQRAERDSNIRIAKKMTASVSPI